MTQIDPYTTIRELMARYPNGVVIGPGTPDRPGVVMRILLASSHLNAIVAEYPFATGNQGYLVVNMDPE